MEPRVNINDLIVVEQLPIIVQHLRGVKANAEKEVQDALSLACTEETVQIVKKRRAELNSAFKDLEARRKAVKKEVMAPYDTFEAVYKECVTDVFGPADKQLAQRIAEVEDGLKQDKAAKVVAYFSELQRANPELEWVNFEDIGLSITLSASLKSLKASVKKYMDDVAKDIECIRGWPMALRYWMSISRCATWLSPLERYTSVRCGSPPSATPQPSARSRPQDRRKPWRLCRKSWPRKQSCSHPLRSKQNRKKPPRRRSNASSARRLRLSIRCPALAL